MTMMSETQFAIVVADFNESITQPLLSDALMRLLDAGMDARQYEVFHVPGAIEIPYVVQQLARRKSYHAIITLGAVIRGETGHYDWVCSQVSDGCMRVILDYNVPVIFGVLTADNLAQAQARVDGTKCFKGREAVDAALQMVRLTHMISASSEQCVIDGE